MKIVKISPESQLKLERLAARLKKLQSDQELLDRQLKTTRRKLDKEMGGIVFKNKLNVPVEFADDFSYVADRKLPFHSLTVIPLTACETCKDQEWLCTTTLHPSNDCECSPCDGKIKCPICNED